MKLTFKYLLLIFIIFYACDPNNSNQTESNNSYKLIEVLQDPGDGSGTFQVVESNKTIKFNDDGTIVCNGSLCDMSLNSDSPTSGTYSSIDMTFKSSDCTNPDYNFNYQIDGSFLIINYPCFEPCQAKYQLIE